ncbi:MAG: translation initiation factor IF-1 [Planctomycetia bacterium]|nr:translation initiation factor IF-1 [Planctomycetia bacterium]
MEREQKTKEECLSLEGTVTEEVRGAFRVKIDNFDHTVLCRLAGKMRKFRIRVVPGDHVKVELSPYDMERGRITYRDKDNPGS